MKQERSWPETQMNCVIGLLLFDYVIYSGRLAESASISAILLFLYSVRDCSFIN